MKILKDILFSFGIAFALLFIPWAVLHNQGFSLDSIELSQSIYSLYILVVCGSLFLFWLKTKAFFSTNRILRYFALFAFYIAGLALLNSVKELVVLDGRAAQSWLLNILMVCSIPLLAYLFYQKPQKVMQVYTFVGVLLSPFACFRIVEDVRGIVINNAPVVIGAGSSKIIWMVFDEMEPEIAFFSRPAQLKLPVLDQFKSESLFATEAHQPGNGTIISFPALITGKEVANSVIEGHNKLRLHFKEGGSALWNQHSTIFTRLNERGLNSALVGFHHPYDRILGHTLFSCHSYFPIAKASLKGWLVNTCRNFIKFNLRDLFRKTGVFKIDAVRRESDRIIGSENCIYLYKKIWKKAKEHLLDSRANLVFLHFSVPHLEWIFDPALYKLTTAKCSYTDNLILVDKTLGKVRAMLEKTGQWDNAVIILSSDHGIRWPEINGLRSGCLTEDEIALCEKRTKPLVPFIVKMPHEKEGIVFNEPFNTRLTQEMILDIVDGKIQNLSELADWLRHHN